MCVCVWRDRPLLNFREHYCVQTSTVLITRTAAITDLCASPVRLFAITLTEKVTMFGFHKSKIYRSNDGCCICKTKSSSSRFTDSSRYEETFRLCFG